MDIKLELEECSIQDSISCGFKQGWISGGSDDFSVELFSSAGGGNKFLQITFHHDNQVRYFRANMDEFLRQFIESMLENENG